jgi:hypothetical protein
VLNCEVPNTNDARLWCGLPVSLTIASTRINFQLWSYIVSTG